MPKRLLLLSCFVLLVALGLSACGGGGDETAKVEEVIKTSATSTNPADCQKLQTQKFMEQVSQESGAAALKECEEEAENEEGAKSAKVADVEVEGSDATAQVTLGGNSLEGQTLELALVQDGSQWKLNEVVKFTKFNQAKLVQSFEKEFKQSSEEVPAKIANCFIGALGKRSQAEVEDLLFGTSSKAFEEVLKSCR